MQISPAMLIHFLMKRGLLPREAVVDGDVTVIQDRSRHTAFGVMRKRGDSFFVKQSQDWQPESAKTLAREADWYGALAPGAPLSSLAGISPKLHLYDPRQNLLVLELVGDAENAAVHHRRIGTLPPAIAAAMGRDLGVLHRHGTAALRILPGTSAFDPWALHIDVATARTPLPASAGNRELLERIRRTPAIVHGLERARKRWSPTTLVHGDVKWENFLLSPRLAAPADLQTKLIDWEIAGAGDPAWDTGSLVQAYLAGALTLPGRNTIDPLADGAVHAALRAFWRGYMAETHLSPSVAADRAVASGELAGVRILQTAFEYLVAAPRMTSEAEALVELSVKMLENPRRIAEILRREGTR